MLFPTAAAPSPAAECEGSLFSTSSPTCAVSCPLDYSDADRCAVASRCGFGLLMSGAERFFASLVAVCVFSLETCLPVF